LSSKLFLVHSDLSRQMAQEMSVQRMTSLIGNYMSDWETLVTILCKKREVTYKI